MCGTSSPPITADVSASGTDWTVNDASVLSVGRAEIGNEIVDLGGGSHTTNSVTIAPYGRAAVGTTAAHLHNDRLVGNPSFPRVTLKRALNDTISLSLIRCSLSPPPVHASRRVSRAMRLPAADGILAVTWDAAGPDAGLAGCDGGVFNKVS